MSEADASAFCGYVSNAQPDGEMVRCSVTSAEGLIADMPLRFRPPAISLAADAAGAEYWWRLLQYVFEDLDEPSLFPSFPEVPADLRSRLDRFVATTESLATSGVMTEPIGITVHVNKGNDSEGVDAAFPRIDLQSGFATLFRQCNNDAESASFKRVKDELWQLNESVDDEYSAVRREYLQAWYQAERRLRGSSLEQLVRHCLATREGWTAFAYREELNPEQLISLVNYGDLIHWNSDTSATANLEAETAAIQRQAFFNAAVGLAHLYIAFGQVVRAALTPPNQLLVP